MLETGYSEGLIMRDHTARLARLLDKRSDVVRVEQPAEALIKRNELLVLDRHADAVHEAARHWVDSRENFPELGVARLRLRSNARVDAAELAHQLRGGADSHRRTSVTPNHVLHGEPSYTGGPFGAPTAAEAMAAPSNGHSPARRVVVGILDTGIHAHPWFAPDTWFSECGADESDVLDENHDQWLDSEAGHGTFVAGVILQQAPSAYLRVEKVLAATDGLCDELELLQGIARLQRRCDTAGDPLDLINLSLGCFTFDDRPSPVLAEVLARVSRTTVVVAAAGNNSSDRPFWPAALKDTVAVAALAQKPGADGPERAEFSNYGWWVDASAPGENVTSSFVTFEQKHGAGFHGYATWSGTSFAAPHVVGSVAALMSAKDVSARDAVSLLLDPTTGTRTPDLGVVVEAGPAKN
jgi:hypothetical protein